MRSYHSTAAVSVTLMVLLTTVASGPARAPDSRPSADAALPYKVSVTPANGSLGDLFADSVGFSVQFTVTNTGTNMDTYDLTCSGTNIVCTSQTYYVATLTPNQSIQVTVNFNTSSTTGSGAVQLFAESPNALGKGKYTFTSWAKVNYAVIVTPVSGTGPNRNSFSSGFTAAFTAKNVGLQRDSFNLTCEPAANISCTSQTLTTTPGMNAFESANYTLTYSTGASGASFIASSAISPNSFATGRWNFTVLVGPSSGVAVTPDSQAVGVRASVPASRPFKVRNTGTASNTYTISVVTCAGSAIASSCTPSPASLTIPAGGTSATTVSYTSGSSGSGTITLKASQTNDPAVKDTGWVNLSIGTMQTPTADVVSTNPGTMLERDLCVAVALAEASASECGDLRLAHPLPAVRTLNKTRVPTLLYSSAAAHPYPLLAANVLLPAGAANPDTLSATLLFNGVARDSGKWVGAGMTPGRAIRIVLGYDGLAFDSTGIYNYTLTVANRYNGQSMLASSVSGQLVVVKRDSSAFGAGWWLAGLELLKNPSPTASTILWVGGDGSAHPYTSAGSNVWAAAALDHPDTLKWNGTQYTRYLPGGLQVRFDAQGRHVSTVNRLGHTTTFHYDANGRLDLLTVPVPPGGAAVSYAFAYTSGQLTSVTAPPLGATPRVTTLTVSGRQVTAITDPDTTAVSFGYDGGFTNRITSRTNRRVFKTTFTFDAGSRITKDSLDPASGQPVIVTQMRALESQGLRATPAGDVLDTALAYTLLDGPRSDLGDSTRLWLDRYGGARRIVNALGGETLLSRTDTRWPVLVTRVQQPNGRVMRGIYDARGHDSTITDSGTVVNGQVAVTRYVWNMTWDAVERVIMPEQDSSVISYDANGNRQWQQDGRGTMSRVTFGYSPTTKLLTSIRLPAATAADSFHYDVVRGNLDTSWTPKGFRTTRFSDALGRDTLVVTPIDSLQTLWQRQQVTYSLADRVIQTQTSVPAMPYTFTAPGLNPDSTTVNAETLLVVNSYDSEGNLSSVRSSSKPDRACYIGPECLPKDVVDNRSYDGADRLLTRSLGSGPTNLTYDGAGNAVRQRYRAGYEVTETYDALNRRVRRIVPTVDYSNAYWSGIYPTTPGRHFPIYPNNGTGYRVAADTSTFVYDTVGNLVEADNKDARVSRKYLVNGLLQSDTLRLRALTGTSFPVFAGLSYGYDRDGRRAWTRLPSQIVITNQDTVRYTYALPLGALSQVRDGAGRNFTFAYDSAGRVDTLRVFPAGSQSPGIIETRVYDADSRPVQRVRKRGNGSGDLINVSLLYDARGKVVQARSHDAAPNFSDEQTRLAYDGMGAVVASEDRNLSGLVRWEAEEFRNNAFGSVWYSRRTTLSDGAEQARLNTLDGHQGLRNTTVDTVPPAGTCPIGWVHEDTLLQRIDPGGNVSMQAEYKTVCSAGYGPLRDMAAMSYYSADNRLVVLQRYDRDRTSTEVGTWEEYRYDALGRRVVQRARRDSTTLCSGGHPDVCVSFVQRTAWDGDQVLLEERNDGNDNSGGAPHYGTFGYVHAGGIDEPLEILDFRFSNPRIPHTNWRGLAESSSWPDGTPADCSIMSAPCTLIAWPAGAGVYMRRVYEPSPVPTWVGSLARNGEDGTGQLYRRNRYYDPLTGRFTQEDPIGLAGGLNQYGFAGGDPVNFSDPFGLCGKHDTDCQRFVAAWEAVGWGVGFLLGGGPGVVETAATAGVLAPVAAAQTLAAAAAGGVAGRALGEALWQGTHYFAQAGHGRGANRVPNKQVRRIANEEGLNNAGRRALHDEITGQNLNLDEVRAIAKQLAEQAKYLKKLPEPPPPPPPTPPQP